MRVVDSTVSRTPFAAVSGLFSRRRNGSARGPQSSPEGGAAGRVRANALGIDIGDGEIHIVQTSDVRYGDGEMGCRVDRALTLPMPARGLLPGGERVVGDAIRKALARAGVAERRCVMGVGGPDAVVDVVQLTRMRHKERRGAAAGEIRRIRAKDLGSDPVVMLGPKVGEGLRGDDGEETGDLYLVGAVKRSAVDFRRAVAKAAGLVLISCEHAGFALRRVCATDGVPPDAVVDVGPKWVTVYAFNGDATYSESDRSEDWVDKTARMVSKLRREGKAKARNVSLVGTRHGFQESGPRLEPAIEAVVSYVAIDDPSPHDDEGVLYSPPWLLAYGFSTFGSEYVARDNGQPTAGALLSEAASSMSAQAAHPGSADPEAAFLAGLALDDAVPLGVEPLHIEVHAPSDHGDGGAGSEDDAGETLAGDAADGDDRPPSIDYAVASSGREASP